MSTQSLMSRIARQLTLRRAEITAHIGSFIAVSLTIFAVGTGWVVERNQVAREIMQVVGVNWWAVATPFAIATAYAMMRYLSRDHPELAQTAGWIFSAVLLLDATLNIAALARNPPPLYMLEQGQVYYVRMAAVGAVAAICLLRPKPPSIQKILGGLPSRQTAVTVGLALLMLTSLPAPFADLSATREASAGVGSGTMFADFEDGTTSPFDGGTIVDSPAIGDHSLKVRNDGFFYADSVEETPESIQWRIHAGAESSDSYDFRVSTDTPSGSDAIGAEINNGKLKAEWAAGTSSISVDMNSTQWYYVRFSNMTWSDGGVDGHVAIIAENKTVLK